jgi:hypothetical protein
MIAHLGPAADEITTIDDAGIKVYDLAGKQRRALSVAARDSMSEPRFSPSGSHVIVASETELDIIDLVAMSSRKLAQQVDGLLAGNEDGTLVGYVDADGLAHVLSTSGAPSARSVRRTGRTRCCSRQRRSHRRAVRRVIVHTRRQDVAASPRSSPR